MAKKDDYKAIKVLIEGGHITEFRQIFDHTYRTNIANDLGIYYSRFKQMMDHIDRFSIQELYQLARLIGVEGKVMVKLAVEQVEKDISDRMLKKKK